MRFQTPLAILATAVLAVGVTSSITASASANPDWGSPPPPVNEWILEGGHWTVCKPLTGYTEPARKCVRSRTGPKRSPRPTPTATPSLTPKPTIVAPSPTVKPTVPPTRRPTMPPRPTATAKWTPPHNH